MSALALGLSILAIAASYSALAIVRGIQAFQREIIDAEDRLRVTLDVAVALHKGAPDMRTAYAAAMRSVSTEVLRRLSVKSSGDFAWYAAAVIAERERRLS